MTWHPSKAVALGSASIDGVSWSVLDYRDSIALDAAGAQLLNLPAGTKESHQCMAIAPAAALCLARATHDQDRPATTCATPAPQPPPAASVLELASKIRSDWLRAALESEALLGDPAPLLTEPEYLLFRMIHDILSFAHSKDFRVWSAYPPPEFATVNLLFLRAHADGALFMDLLLGTEATREAPLLCVLLWQRHLCLLYTSPSPRDATLSRMPSSA